MQCPNGHEVPTDASFCPTCGSGLESRLGTPADTATDAAPRAERKNMRARGFVPWLIVGFVIAATVIGVGYLTTRPTATERAAQDLEQSSSNLVAASGLVRLWRAIQGEVAVSPESATLDYVRAARDADDVGEDDLRELAQKLLPYCPACADIILIEIGDR